MLPRLPTEVHERVIDFLSGESRTLASCALACRAWVPRSRARLYESIGIWRASDFSALLDSIASTPTHPIQYNLLVLRAQQLFHMPPPFIHLIPILLSGKVPLLEYLALEPHPYWKRKSPEQPNGERIFFPIHPSYGATLPHFRSVKRLQMKHYRFYSFIDFQRLIASFPILSELDCQDVTWEDRCLDLRKIPRPAPCRLFDVQMHDCQEDQWRVLHFWLQPLRISPPRARPVRATSCHIIPSFSFRDGIALSGLITYLYGWAQPEPETHHVGRGWTTFSWEGNLEHDVWRLCFTSSWLIRPTKDFCLLILFKPQVKGLAEGTLAIAQFPVVPYFAWGIEARVAYAGEDKDDEYFRGLDKVLAQFEVKPGLEFVKLQLALHSMPNQNAIERKTNQILALMEWTKLHCGIEILFEGRSEDNEQEENGGEEFVLVN